ncbi:hypothetical protein [Sphingomonas sp. VNH70]|uniref:WD40/YVTN/BNR-like repeat-containing protein n=1 Tax=Sphingomonas silueang TaxID=3156617 RepID=UPI0032B61E8E
MQRRDRNAIRYDQFVKPERRSRGWLWAILAVGLIAALGYAAWAWFLQPAAALTTPPALSSAGRPVPNEAYQWKAVAIGGGGYITGLAMDPKGETMVARADVYGAYIWDKKADRWKQLMTAAAFPPADRVQDGIAEGAYAIAVAPSRSQRVYLATKGRVYRSDDRGAHFVQSGQGNPFPLEWDANSEFRLHGPYLTVDPTNPDLVLLGTPGSGLWRSADGGNSWNRVASVPTSVDRRPPPGIQAPGTLVWFETGAGAKPTGRILAMASGRGMYVSTDRGASFRPLAAGGAGPMTLRHGTFDRNGVFFAADDETQTIWSLRDGAWHNLTTEAGLPAKKYGAIAANPRADQVVVFDWGGAGYQSSDGGRTWRTLSHTAEAGPKDPPWLRLADQSFFPTGDIQFDPVVANRLWVAAGTGVFYADLTPESASADWISQSRGIEEIVANDIVQTPGHAPMFAGWDFGIHIKPDLNAYSTTFQPGERSLIAAQQIDWTPADPSYVVTNATDTRMGCCWQDGNTVMAGYSRDGGQSWTKFATLPQPPGTKADDPWRMSFGTIAVSSGDTGNIVWAPAFNRTPFYTKNRGRNWEPVRLPGAQGDNPGSFEHQWYQRKTLASDKSIPGTFYYYHSGEAPNQGLTGLWRSQDGGATWSQVFAGEIMASTNAAAKLRSVPGHAGHLFFTSGHAHAAESTLRRSIDGGATWVMVPDVDRVDDVAFGKAAPGSSYPTIFVSGKVGGVYGIWRSVDDAKTWVRLVDFPVGTLDQVTAIGADPDVFGRVYLGYKGSGYIWGEPAPCKPAPLASLATVQCSAVGR